MAIPVTSREMGFLEKIAVIFHDKMAGSCSIAVMVDVKTILDYQQFKQAWEILFQRQPMLRATYENKQDKYYFNFNAKFSDIPLKHINTDNFSDVMKEYSQDIVRPFDFTKNFWRATLVTMPSSTCSYIIFAAGHTVSDSKSISHVLGDLLRVMQELQQGLIPHTNSLTIPLALDDILDRTKFKKPIDDNVVSQHVMFEQNTLPETAQSANLLHAVKPDDFIKLLQSCRKHGVTITAALNAALAKSLADANSDIKKLVLSIAVDFRPYTKTLTTNAILAFYAHQIMFDLDLNDDQDFWVLAKQAKQQYQKILSEYVLFAADDQAVFNDIFTHIKSSQEQQHFFIPYSVSNAGVLDSSFENLSEALQIKNYYFTVLNQAVFPLAIFAATINNQLCLNFNFSIPALTLESATKLTDNTMRHLLNYLD